MENFNRVVFDEVAVSPESVLRVETVTPEPLKENQVRVRMLAAPINPADINFVQGVYGLKPVFPHSVAGLEGVGEVVESSSDVLSVGDTVISLSGAGSWSEYRVDDVSCFMKIRSEIPKEQAAMLKVNPLTAYRVLMGFVDLKPGDWIVQNAANSGVGRCVIQIAKAMGVKTINLVRRPELLNELAKLGGDVVVVDDADAEKKVLALTGGVKPVLASNCVGGESALRLMSMLAPQGKMVTFGAMSKKSIKVPNSFLIFKGIQLLGLWVTQWIKSAPREEVASAYDYLGSLMAEGKLSQAIDGRYELKDIQQAVKRAQAEARNGKVVLVF